MLYTKLLNEVALLHKKMDILMEYVMGADEVDKLGLPEAMGFKYRSPAFETMESPKPESTIEPPVMEPAEGTLVINATGNVGMSPGPTSTIDAIPFPIDNYDSMTVGEVMKAVREAELDGDQKAMVLEYEIQHKNRSQVISFLED